MDQADVITEQLAYANESQQPLFITGGGSKSFYGYRPDQHSRPLDVTGHSGIIEYEPSELVIRVRSGTLLSEVEQVLAEEGQMLAFEPPAFSAATTLGGVVATGLSGPRRAYTGSVRDFVLGVTLLSGDAIKMAFGGQVMKNVAGYDISRLMAGSMGVLGVILDASFKVLPLPETELTLCQQLDKQIAFRKMVEIARLPLPVSGTFYYGDKFYIRLSGNEAVVKEGAQRIGGEECTSEIWTAVRNQELQEFTRCKNLWRVSVKPASRALLDEAVMLEWGGGLRWLMDPQFNPREKLASASASASATESHATLFRYQGNGPEDVFQPLQPRVLQIHRNLKSRFDPKGILNPGHMHKEL